MTPQTLLPASVALSNTIATGAPPMCSNMSFRPWVTQTVVSSPNTCERAWLDCGNDIAR